MNNGFEPLDCAEPGNRELFKINNKFNNITLSGIKLNMMINFDRFLVVPETPAAFFILAKASS